MLSFCHDVQYSKLIDNLKCKKNKKHNQKYYFHRFKYSDLGSINLVEKCHAE